MDHKNIETHSFRTGAKEGEISDVHIKTLGHRKSTAYQGLLRGKGSLVSPMFTILWQYPVQACNYNVKYNLH